MISKQKEWPKSKIRVALFVFLLVGFTVMLGGCAWFADWLNSSPAAPRPITEQEAREILDTQTAAREMYETLTQEGALDAVDKVLNWLKDQSPIKDAQVTESGNISILYRCGLPASIITGSFDESTPLSPSVSSLALPSYQVWEEGGNNYHFLSTSPGPKEAIILLPFEKDFGVPSGIDKLKIDLERIGYTVEGPILNADVTVDRFLLLKDYTFIYIETHGAAHDSLLSHRTAIATGVPVHWYSLQSWWQAIGTGIEINSVPSGGDYLAVNGRLLENYQYPGSLVIISACESFKNNTLANAFLDNGAKVFFGWTEKSCPMFSDIATYMLTELITKPNFTIHDAYTTPVRVDIGPLHADWSIDKLFPWTLTFSPETKEYKPDFKKAGDNDFILNPAELVWSPRAPMPTPRAYAPAVVHQGQIYVVGGCSSDVNQQFYNAVASLEVYDPAFDAWTVLPSMPTPRVGPAAAVVGNKIYVIGGFTRSTWSANPVMEVYDINSGQWSTGPSKPTPCSWARAAVWHDKIYVFGGVGQGYFNVGEVFDPATNTWSSCASFSGGRYLQAVVTVDDKIYLIGGDRWDPRQIYDDVQVYDPFTDSWTAKAPMPTAASNLDAVVVDNKIWVFNGSGLCRVYDIAADRWEEKISTQNPASSFSVAYFNGFVYRFGGGSWGPTLDIVEAAAIAP